MSAFLRSWFTRSIIKLRLGRFSFITLRYSAKSAFASRAPGGRHSISPERTPASVLIAQLQPDFQPGMRKHIVTKSNRRVVNTPTILVPLVPKAPSRAVQRVHRGGPRPLGTRSRFDSTLPKRQHGAALKAVIAHTPRWRLRTDDVVPYLVSA